MKPRAQAAIQAVPTLNEEGAALASYLDALLGNAPTVAVEESRDQAVHPLSEPFDCLLLTVDGMTLALPIEDVRAVIPLPASLSGASLAHDKDHPWLIGECEHRAARIRLVDVVAMLTFGEMAVARDRAGLRVVLIAGAEIGLACDGTAGPVSVHPGQVRWRTAHTRRPWLAGIVTAPSCALLDARALAGMLCRPAQTGRRGQTP